MNEKGWLALVTSWEGSCLKWSCGNWVPVHEGRIWSTRMALSGISNTIVVSFSLGKEGLDQKREALNLLDKFLISPMARNFET